MTGTLLNNRYQILQVLGKGGFGETFLAIDTHMPSARKCVIKQLKPAIQTPQIPQWLQERFSREAAILEKLGENNPQIPRLYAYFSEGSDFYLVQEWIEGATLSQKHQQQGNFSESEVKKILLDLLPVLDYIHTRRIIHRDIKPDNIILRSSDCPLGSGKADRKSVLIDFGVMKEAVATTMLTSNGMTNHSIVLGTPGYMSSEQAAGRPVYSSDLYSLGLTAIFLLTGKTPQYIASDVDTGELLWRQELPNLHSNLASVLDKALRFHPRDRFSSAKEMLAALQGERQDSTMATVVVAPKANSTSLKGQATIEPSRHPKASPSTYTPSSPDEPENTIMPWIFGLLLFAGVTAGAFAIGYYAFSMRSQREPTPINTFNPDPQTFPPIPSPQPAVTPTPTPEATISPAPEETPTPEATISPSPEDTPTPEATISPAPEDTPTPEATISPAPEDTPTPEATISPSPEDTPTPEATIEPKPPESEITPEPNSTPENQSNTPEVPVFQTETP
ncbi:MAG: protein kinase [Hydrococcus sp. Prado102]|jgi:serine/threonine-protein kinase|nr:protein kinase [Hydrococcus sp. Prado102]